MTLKCSSIPLWNTDNCCPDCHKVASESIFMQQHIKLCCRATEFLLNPASIDNQFILPGFEYIFTESQQKINATV